MSAGAGGTVKNSCHQRHTGSSQVLSMPAQAKIREREACQNDGGQV